MTNRREKFPSDFPEFSFEKWTFVFLALTRFFKLYLKPVPYTKSGKMSLSLRMTSLVFELVHKDYGLSSIS